LNKQHQKTACLNEIGGIVIFVNGELVIDNQSKMKQRITYYCLPITQLGDVFAFNVDKQKREYSCWQNQSSQGYQDGRQE
jgi:hypothetical protein